MFYKSLLFLLFVSFISFQSSCFSMAFTPEEPKTPIIEDDEENDELTRAGSPIVLNQDDNDQDQGQAFQVNQGMTIVHGTHEEKGNKRSTMEDAHYPCDQLNSLIANGVEFFGLYDGHGGPDAALYAQDNLHKNIKITQSFSNGDYKKALINGYENTSDNYRKNCSQNNDGTTAVTALFAEKRLWIANVGDSEAVACFNGKDALCITQIHSPDNEQESQRILQIDNSKIVFYKANKIVTKSNIDKKIKTSILEEKYFLPRQKIALNGLINKYLQSYSLDGEEEYIDQFKQVARVYQDNIGLSVSRGIGERALDKYLIATPFVQDYQLDQPGFLILGCDGLWDVMSYQAAVNFVLRELALKELSINTATEDVAGEIAEKLVLKALEIDDHDNVTVTVIFFTPNQ